jgi:chromosome segregation ATPase
MKTDKTKSSFEETVLSALARLQSDVSGVKTDISGLKTNVSSLKTDVSDLKADVSGLKTDVSSLKTDVNGLKINVSDLKNDIGILKTDLGDLKADVCRLEVLHEETDSKIDHILEVLIPNTNEIIEIRDHEAEQDETILFHERRISFLEKKVA